MSFEKSLIGDDRAAGIDGPAGSGHIFATGEGARLAVERLPTGDYQPPRTSVVKPIEGAVLRGATYLVATATGDFPITSVQFQVSGIGGQPREQFHATRFLYGFLGGWPTTDVPNGSYVIKSIVRDSYGQVRTSQPLSVTVDN